MANPPLITLPFANAGDQSVPPQTSPQGFVNFTSGYTPDYELSLTAGDPQAKAVERAVQNFLFNATTANVQAWQVANRPPWYNNMPGGYSKYAEINFPNLNGEPVPYRCMKDGNVASPSGGVAAGWEYLQSTSEMIANIPMPSGGPNGPGSYLYTTPVDFNTLTASGTFQFASDAVVTGSPNAPQNGGNKGGAGMLEVNAWTQAGSTYITQLFRDRNGLALTRGSTNGSWTIWKIWANATQFVVGEIRFWYGTATDAAVQAAWGPGWHLCNGANNTPNLADTFLIGASGTRGVGSGGGTFNYALSVANMPAHNHVINIGDPGHAHGVSQNPHAHGISDPGHAHGVADPGHQHSYMSVGQFGRAQTLSPGNTGIGNTDNTSASGTGIGIYGNGTGISIASANANIGIAAAGTGIYANSNNTGSGAAFAVVPPYYAVSVVMFTGA